MQLRESLFKILFFSFLAFIASNTQTIIKNEVRGENASVETKIINEVNGKKTIIESNEPGTIKVESKNGDVKVESSSNDVKINPTVSVTKELKTEVEKALQVEEVENVKIGKLKQSRNLLLIFLNSVVEKFKNIFI